jgi:hypothetical protein
VTNAERRLGNNRQNETRSPHPAYTSVKREGAENFWLAIGAAFMHQDGEGYNIGLQALPIDGRIILRLSKGDEQTPETGPHIATGTDRARRAD